MSRRPQYLNCLTGCTLILSGLMMACFWTSFALFLPMQSPYIDWVLDRDWTWVNLLGFGGAVLGVLSLFVLFSILQRISTAGMLGLVLGVAGSTMLAGVLYFETFMLKGLARAAPELVDLGGPFYHYPVFRFANLSGGVMLTAGAVLLGLVLVRQAVLKRWKVSLWMVANPLFGLVILPGNLRLIGVLLYAVSMAAMGWEVFNKEVGSG